MSEKDEDGQVAETLSTEVPETLIANNDSLDSLNTSSGSLEVLCDNSALILPWKRFKKEIEGLGISPHAITINKKANNGGDIKLERSWHKGTLNSGASMTIPHGFQIAKSMILPRPSSLQSALYVASTQVDSFATLDSHNVQVFRGNSRVLSIPIGKESNSPLAGISRWIFLKNWKATIISTQNIELKVIHVIFH
jgi:hypothetical protein